MDEFEGKIHDRYKNYKLLLPEYLLNRTVKIYSNIHKYFGKIFYVKDEKLNKYFNVKVEFIYFKPYISSKIIIPEGNERLNKNTKPL